MSAEIDPSTGMPVVPEGYFWRVFTARNAFTRYGILHIQLRKKTWWRSRLIDEHTSLPESTDNVAHTVQRYAQHVLADQAHRAEMKTTLDRLAGDYPPKRMQ